MGVRRGVRKEAMTYEQKLAKVWNARAKLALWVHWALCPMGGYHDLDPDNKRGGVSPYCKQCLGGAQLGTSVVESKTGPETLTETRKACWMCGGWFSRPRTREEYETQLCIECLDALKNEGLRRY